MSKKQIKLRILLLVILLSMVGSACMPIMLETIFDKQEQQAKARVAIYEKNNGRQPTQALLLAKIAVGYAKLGQQEKASKLLIPALVTAKSNNSFDIRTELLRELGVIYIEMGQYDKALEVAKSLQAYKPIDKDIELKHITIQMAKAGQYDKALQTAKLISVGGVFSGYTTVTRSISSQATVMAEVALKYAQIGQKGKAEQILAQALQIAKTSNEQMVEVALKYAQIGQKGKAEQILAQVSQNAQDTSSPSDSTFLAVKYEEVGQQSKAEQLLAQALQKTKKVIGSQDSFLTDLAIGYAKIGQFNQAINTAKSIEGYADVEDYKEYITPDGLINGTSGLDVFAEIAKKCVEVNRFDLALEAIKEIKRTGNRSEALTHLAVRYAASDRFDLALLTIDNIKETGNSSQALAQLAIYYGTVGQYDKAFQLLKEIDFEYIKIEALIKIVEQATQVKSPTRAKQLLVPALKMVKTTRLEHVNKAASLTAIAIEYAKLGQQSKAEQLLAQALQITENNIYY